VQSRLPVVPLGSTCCLLEYSGLLVVLIRASLVVVGFLTVIVQNCASQGRNMK